MKHKKQELEKSVIAYGDYYITQLCTMASEGPLYILLDGTLKFHAFLQSDRKPHFIRLCNNLWDSPGIKYSIFDLNSHFFQQFMLTYVTSLIRLHLESRNDLLHW